MWFFLLKKFVKHCIIYNNIINLEGRKSMLLKKKISAILAFLIGIDKFTLDNHFDNECDILFENENALKIRYLNRIRTTLFLHYKYISKEIQYNMKNINTIDYFNYDEITWLMEHDIKVMQSNCSADKYLYKIGILINEHINDCKNLFPEWVKWEYIKDLFIIPKTLGGEAIAQRYLKEEGAKFQNNLNNYPFQMYIHWNQGEYGNILMNDKKLLNILYQLHNDVFDDDSKIYDANDGIKQNIYNFIDNSDSSIIVVDCENADVYKLYSVLKGLNPNELSKISKIILYDDKNTTFAWKLLKQFTDIETEHINVERVTYAKSLVDIKLTAGVCKEFYENHVDSFILFSSDSDFWGLISSLPTANFLVMIESSKCGENIKETLRENRIYYCSVDDFSTFNISQIYNAALKDALQKELDKFNITGIWNELNSRLFIDQLYKKCRINATENERQNFIDKYIKTIKFKINEEGNFYLSL